MHYNQHGLLLVQGQGIYRLADKWYPVQSGDAIWMAPYVLQWYAALGNSPSRYILFKDTTQDPGTVLTGLPYHNYTSDKQFCCNSVCCSSTVVHGLDNTFHTP